MISPKGYDADLHIGRTRMESTAKNGFWRDTGMIRTSIDPKEIDRNQKLINSATILIEKMPNSNG